MNKSDVMRAKALLETHEQFSKFETAESRGEVLYLKLFRSDGDKIDEEYHLGGIDAIADIMKDTRSKLDEEIQAMGLEKD